MTAPPRTFEVGPSEAGGRLDRFLAARLELSRAQVRRLLARGAVRLDGRPTSEADKGTLVAGGCEVEVAAFRRPEHERIAAAPDVLLEVLARGPGWLAVDKPAGLPVHPLHEDETRTVLGAVAALHPEVRGVGEGGLRSGVVHRLDLDTSGVLLVATREDAWQRLREAFREHRVTKVYRALVAGRIERGEAELALVTARHRPARVRVVTDDRPARSGAPSRAIRMSGTRWRPLAFFEDATLVEARPRTGHLHQLRATFAHLGHPILGDRTYAPADVAERAPRQMLHAAEVGFEEVRASAADPPDFAAALARQRESWEP